MEIRLKVITLLLLVSATVFAQNIPPTSTNTASQAAPITPVPASATSNVTTVTNVVAPTTPASNVILQPPQVAPATPASNIVQPANKNSGRAAASFVPVNNVTIVNPTDTNTYYVSW
jgi:hypothetical protein